MSQLGRHPKVIAHRGVVVVQTVADGKEMALSHAERPARRRKCHRAAARWEHQERALLTPAHRDVLGQILIGSLLSHGAGENSDDAE